MINRYNIMDNLPTEPIITERIRLPLPNVWYFVWVPQIATYEIEEIETFGVPMEGENNNLSDADLNKLILVKWPLVKMVEAFSSGYRVSFEDRNDLIKLNDVIEEYFDKINEVIESNRINTVDVDHRLEALDKFNRSIYNNNTGKILRRREAIIKHATLDSLLPNIIYQEVTKIENTEIVSDTEDKNNGVAMGRYTSYRGKNDSGFDRMDINKPIINNPLSPIYSQSPDLDFNRLQYESRFKDPEERRLLREYNNAKKTLKEKETHE